MPHLLGINIGKDRGPGSGSALGPVILSLAGVATAIATAVSVYGIYLHIKNYRKPHLQRMVIRIILMVPLYAISSLISLFSLDAAFVIDAIRDIYEAFVIYCFFQLLLAYLGGERSLLILLHGRPPKDPVFPATLFQKELDVSDPYTFLFLKRGILQYVQVKPILALATLILKAAGKYNEGDLRADAGYLYISIVYNVSICLSLYCLAVFWMVVSSDLKPFRPMPKFLCVKGILFFSFWQSIGISILVAAGVITALGPYTDSEHISLGLTDTLICLEMPLFAIAHAYAFSYRDYVDPNMHYVARMRMWYAMKDAFGLKDVLEDSKATLRGEGMDYRTFEPSEGYIHQGVGRTRRIRAGLRYADGGKKKYWLPKTTAESDPLLERADRGVNEAIGRIAGHGQEEDVYAPMLEEEADQVVHLAPDLQSPVERDQVDSLWVTAGARQQADEDLADLEFGEPDEADEELFEHAKKYVFGDYNYPCIDVSSENARKTMWAEEERILSDERGAYFSPIRGPQAVLPSTRGKEGYGAVSISQRQRIDSLASSSGSPKNGKNQSKGKGRSTPQANGTPRIGTPRGEEGYLVDHEPDRVLQVDSKDFKLRWTSVRRTKSSQGQDPASEPHSPAHTPSPKSPPALKSRTSHNSNASAPPTPSEDNQRALPPDAVDLVVEDEDRAEEELASQRRHGEPAMHGGLRKVYRRGYVVRDENGEEKEGEVEVERDGSPGEESGPGEDERWKIGEDEDEDGEDGKAGQAPEEFTSESVIEPVAERVPTPDIVHRGLDRIPHEELDNNPWA